MTVRSIAVVAVLLLAGCAGNSSTDDAKLETGKTEQVILPPKEVAGGSESSAGGKADASEGNGEIRGTVQDDGGLPLEGVSVGLLGSEFSTVTNATGGFRFANVTAGEHTVRVTPTDVFRVHEGAVTVVPGRVTLVTITLVPMDGRGPGYRPHLHDYWGDKTELPLVDLELDWMGANGCGSGFSRYGAAGELVHGVYEPNNANWWVCFGIPDSGTLPPIVLPGTAQLRFKVAWGNDVDVDRFQIEYHSAGMGGGKYAAVGAMASGEEKTVDLVAEDPDNGHQLFSLWVFRIKPEPRSVPMTIMGPIQITITAIRGDLPVDPPHEDFWQGNTSIVARAWDPPRSGGTVCCTDWHHTFPLDSKKLIPPGTMQLRIRFSVVVPQQPGTPADLTWDLYAKPANLPPGTSPMEYRELQPTGTNAGVKEYVVPVPPGETDAFYQTQSNWMFSTRADPDLPEGFQETGRSFRLEVIAEKDPAFV